jgi:hypothetical protein
LLDARPLRPNTSLALLQDEAAWRNEEEVMSVNLTVTFPLKLEKVFAFRRARADNPAAHIKASVRQTEQQPTLARKFYMIWTVC